METSNPHSFYSLTLPQLESVFESLGEKSYRSRQLFKWVYQKGVERPSEMTDFSKVFRKSLENYFSFQLPKLFQKRISQDGTRKYLFEVGEGHRVETVLIPAEKRRTLCVSSEVGCNLACRFCFTGKQKLKHRLETHEIVGQFVQVQRDLGQDQPITNVVFMGMGEPLDNPEAVFDAIDILKNDLGLAIGRKKITVSTVGWVSRIPLVTHSGVRLAVSLNASNDEVRDQIMPINRKHPLKELMGACREHTRWANDRVTFEYVLLKGVTDSLTHAKELVQRIQSIPCKVNLIPFNEHPDSGFVRPESKTVFQFQKYLLNQGFNVTVRRTMGRDIFAACGQLTSVSKHLGGYQEVPTGVLG